MVDCMDSHWRVGMLVRNEYGKTPTRELGADWTIAGWIDAFESIGSRGVVGLLSVEVDTSGTEVWTSGDSFWIPSVDNSAGIDGSNWTSGFDF